MGKKIIWMGNSKEKLIEFPEEVRRNIGYALSFAEKGEKHPSAKPLKAFDGVFEIVENAKSGTYRAVYAAKINDFLYILHVFQKKAKQGISTPKKEIALIRERLIRAKNHYRSCSLGSMAH